MKKRNKKKRRNFKKSNIARRRRRRSQDAYGISFESLEDRKLLAGVTVSTAADFVDGNIATVSSLIASPGPDGAISLREAITAAENTFGTDSINFDAATFNGEAADVIRLQSPLVVFDSIEIDAGDLGVVVSGDSAGNDALVAGSFITDVEASVFAGNFDDNTDSVFVFPGDFQEVTISGLTITSGDSSDSGGGVLVPNSAAVVINESTIAGNRAAISGGGIQSNNGLLIIQQSSISGNVANNPQIFTGAYGGGINTDSGSLMVYDSTISGNEARGEVSQGGGIRAGGSLSLTNSTVSGNIASTPFPGGAFGGGLFTQSLNVSILNSTITENTADIGGGIANDNAVAGGAPLLVDNSIIAGNSAGFDGPDLISSVLVEHDVSFSLIGDNSNSSLEASPSGVADANGNFIGTSNFVIDPQLGELADNGGPTLTHALLATSPANNSGNTTIPFDQRGVVRESGGGSDIGAFELDVNLIVVDSNEDFFDGDFSLGNLTLREAIEISESTPETDTIIFDPSVFNGEQEDVIYLEGTLGIFESITIDAGDLGVVISGDVSRNDPLIDGTVITDVEAGFNLFDNVQVFETFVLPDSVVTFRGLTITGGAPSFGDGGGILSNDGALVIEDSIVSGNRAYGAGGGIFAESGSVTITDSSISANRSELGYATYDGGGGVGTTEADVTIVNSSVSGNFARSNGGGVHSEVGNITITNSTISENSTNLYGGGISALNGNLAVTGSTVSGNIANLRAGGGIVNGSGAVDISNSTISGNVADRDGSGVHTFEGAVTITDSTITQNVTQSYGGAGVWADSRYVNTLPSLTVRNSIIAGNFRSPDFSFDLDVNDDVAVDITSSLIGTNLTSPLTPAPIGFPDANGNIIGEGFNTIDPMLGDLADNGGPTQTHALLGTSPAIDAGNSLATTDQRGELRPFDQPSILTPNGGNNSDIGAFEFQSLILTVDSSIDLVDGDFSPGNLSLREAITLANDNPGTDTILFASNVFNGQSSDVIRLQSGELQITDGVVINAGDSPVVVSADASGNDVVDPDTFITDLAASSSAGTLVDNIGRVFNITTAVGENVTFTGLTVTGGSTLEGGGGINANSVSLELVDTSVSGNVSVGDGGGVLSDQDLILTNSTVSGNVSDGNVGGGGIRVVGGDVLLNSSVVTGNIIFDSGQGGGISTDTGDVILDNSNVSGNQSGLEGGGVFTETGAVRLLGSTVSGNQSSLGGGGIATVTGAITVSASTVSDNEALFAGGGIQTSIGTVLLSNSTLSNNSTTSIGNGGLVANVGGGGIFNRAGFVSVDRSTVSGNSTLGNNAAGGAIATTSGQVSTDLSTFAGNSTSGNDAEGGAIATTSGDVTITFSTFSGNSTLGVGSGGGALATTSGDVAITFSTFSGNSTLGLDSGGGALVTTSGDVTITSSTITENSVASSSSFGGGVFLRNTFANSSDLTIDNSIIAANSSRVGNDLLVGPTTSLNVNFSLIGDNTGTPLAATTGPNTSGNLIGSFSANIDPLLDVLADNGGETLTHALLAGSPAIDAGSSLVATDQRGGIFVRTEGNAADIGAFEFQVLNLLVDTELDIVNGNFFEGNLSLREAIALANDNPGEDFIRFSPDEFRGRAVDAIHLEQGELTITESVNIDGEELGVVITGDRSRDDVNVTGTAITDLASSSDFQLDDNSRVFNITAAAGEVVALNGLIITGGIGSDGGGIRNEAADLVLAGTMLTGNRALGNGGAIFNEAGLVTISNSTLSENETAGDNSSGGGIHTNTGAISLTNSTVSGNRSVGVNATGGGVSSAAGDVTLSSVTITNNEAGEEGGGVFVDDSALNPSLLVNNTIIAENTAVISPDLRFGSGLPIDITFSLIGDNSGTTLVAAAVGSPDANGNLIGDAAAVIDPLLRDLADNGGLTFTHEPRAFSPVIDAGGSTLANDQRNISLLGRDDGGGVDIGSVERFQFFLVVDTSSDIDDGDLSAGNLSLREALAISNTNPTVDVITFDPDVFNQEPSDVIRLQLGELAISDGVVIDAQETGVIITADANGDDVLVPGSFVTDIFASDASNTLDDNGRVINITAPAGDFTSFIGLTITGGATPGFFDEGGGVRNEDASLAFANTTISGNSASGSGGGIHTSDGALTLQNSIVNDNFSDDDGGGIFAEGRVGLSNTSVTGNSTERDGGGIFVFGDAITLTDSSVSENQTTDRFGEGGGIFTFGADVTLNNSVVDGNITGESGNGGGIHSSSGDVTLNNSSVSGNTAGLDADGGGISTGSGNVSANSSRINGNSTGEGGGGISTGSGSVTFNDSSLSDNTAGEEGGGATTSTGDLIFDRSTISGNQSGLNGGGIETSFGDVLLTNSTLSGNQSGAEGGGIYQDTGDETRLVNSTVVNNQSEGDGGGIFHDGATSFDALRIENSIVAENVSVNGNGPDLRFSSRIASVILNSLIGSNVGTPIQPTASGGPNGVGNRIGSDAAPIDPLLGDLADNGGPTLTHALLAGSPAINAGGPVSADIGDTDQRGEVRIAEGQIDIGAFEFESAFLLGDVNRDGAVTFFDIFPFIEVLSANGFQAEADIDQDGAVSFFDISPFIDLLSAPSTGGTTNFSTAFSSVSVPQSDFSSAQLTAAPSAPSLSSSDVAVTQLNAEISDSPVLAFVGGGQVQNLDDTRNLQNGISDRNSGVNAMQLSDEKTDSLAGSQASSAPAVAASSADLFDANPELLDELVDFELDEVFEGLVI